MARFSWRPWLACVLSLSLSGCATVKVPAKRYVAVASVSGAKPAKKSRRGRELAPELQKTGVLWAGDKIAVLPGYPCNTEVHTDCYREIDELEDLLKDEGFWVEPWRELRVSRSKNRFSEVKKRGIEHALIVDAYSLKTGGETEQSVEGISLVEQDEAKKPKPLVLEPEDWKVVGPRCVNYFTHSLQENAAAPTATMSVRLISVSPERVLWTQSFEERAADPEMDLQLIHDVPKTVKNKRAQRFWGLGLAGTGVALGVGTGLGARKMTASSTLIMTGVAVGLATLGSWLAYSARPREVYPKGPAELLCKPNFKAKDAINEDGEAQPSSSFKVTAADSDEPVNDHVLAAELQSSLVNDVARSVVLLTRSEWEKPKKKNKKKKDKKGTLACVWQDRELRCPATCSRCGDPWEGSCAVCRPVEGKRVARLADLEKSKSKPLKVVVVNAQELRAKDKRPEDKPKKSKPAKGESAAQEKTKTKTEAKASKDDKKSKSKKKSKGDKKSKKSKDDKKAKKSAEGSASAVAR